MRICGGRCQNSRPTCVNPFGPGDDYAGRPGPQDDDKPCVFALFELAAAAILLAVLLWWPHPAAAQCCDDSAPEPVTVRYTYLPLVAANQPRTWFTPDELSQAQQAAGYDPAVVAEHTVCTLHASTQPPTDIRYSDCLQHWYAGQPTDGRIAVHYWYDGEAVLATPISSTKEQQ
jgi:hypothetical protein